MATFTTHTNAVFDRPRIYLDATLGFGLDQIDTAAAVEFAREVLAADRTW